MSVSYDLQTMFIGQMFGPETMDCEYKEFVLRCLYRFFEKQVLNDMIHSNIALCNIRLNNATKMELKHYFSTYLPKYFSNFITSKITGHLHIGVTDSGIVEGFPYHGNTDSLDTYIKRIFKNSLENVRILS